MATAKNESTALATVASTLPALRVRASDALAAIRENLGGESVSPFDLPRIKVPAGGGKFWAVPSPTAPDGVPSATVRGVIVWSNLGRAFWSVAFDQSAGGGTPPDCASGDGLTGIGNPGGVCATCVHSQWGSAQDGRGGQACSAYRVLVMLLPEQSLPVVVTVPASSLTPLRKYLIGLGRHYHEVVTELALVEAASKVGGIKYSKISPRCVEVLDDEQRMSANEWYEAIRHAGLSGAPTSPTEVSEG